MDVATQPQLHAWLQEHGSAIIDHWQPLLGSIWPQDIQRWSPDVIQQVYQLLIKPNDDQQKQALHEIVRTNRTLGLQNLIQLPLLLRRAIITEFQQQQLESSTIVNLLHGIDPLMDQHVTLLAQLFNLDIEEEQEYLLEQQAQMAIESDQQALQLSMLYDISQTLSSTLERDEILSNIGPRLLRAFDVEHCALLTKKNDGSWVVQRGWGPQWKKLSGRTLSEQELPTALLKASKTNKFQVLESMKKQPEWLITDQPAVFMPLIHEPLITGCVVAQSPELVQKLDSATRKLWQTVISQIGVALENTQLYDTVQALNTDLERKVAERTSELREERDRLEAIADIARDISTLEIDVLLNRILQALANLTGVRHGSVMLIDSGTGLLVDRAVLSETQHPLGTRRFQVGEGIVGWIAQYRQPALVNDVENDDRWVELDAFGQVVGKHAGALVGVPLIAGDDVVGVLMLSHPQAHYFNQSHLRLLKAIAGEIAIAIYNAQLYEYLGERTNKLYSMLRHQEEVSSQNNAILQSLADAVIVVNTQRNVILANNAAEQILDTALDQLLTQTFDELIENLNIKLPGDPLTQVLNYNGSERPEPLSLTLNYNTRALRVSMVPVITERGELLGACLIGRDITREVESDRLKTEFIGTVSHELRTPMTSIKGYTQLLAMGSLGDVNETQKEFLTTITDNAERMIAIINDLLDITKIETGSVELNPTKLRLTEVLSEVISTVREDLTKREHDFSLNLAPQLPPLWVDPDRIDQVLENMLSNAIKYTPPKGRITVHANEAAFADLPEEHIRGLNRSRRFVRITVQDTGVGIDPAEHDKVFERFYRTENQLKIEAGGTGLGLSLVRPLIQLMGGRIWVDSKVGEGSTFTILVPAINE